MWLGKGKSTTDHKIKITETTYSQHSKFYINTMNHTHAYIYTLHIKLKQ